MDCCEKPDITSPHRGRAAVCLAAGASFCRLGLPCRNSRSQRRRRRSRSRRLNRRDTARLRLDGLATVAADRANPD